MAFVGRAPLDETEKALIGKIGLLASVQCAYLPPLLAQCRVAGVPAGTLLYDQDAVAEGVFVVLAGQVGLLLGVDGGRRCLIEILGPGRLFGEGGLFDTGRYPSAAQAITAARIAIIPLAPLLAAIGECATLRQRMLAYLSGRLRLLVGQIAQLKLMSAAQRLAAFLLSQAEPDRQGGLVHLQCERRVIAGMLGMTPESLSRAFRHLHGLQVSSPDRNTVVIADLSRLRRYVATDPEILEIPPAAEPLPASGFGRKCATGAAG